MPSIPKTSGQRLPPWLGGLLFLAVAGALIAAVVTRFPEPPQAPRYVGAGNDEPRSGGVLRIAESGNLHTLDPQISYDVLGTTATRLMFDGLLDYDFDANFVPSIAESLPEVSPDGKRFTFRLRKDVKFHNGRPLTADDVSWSMHRLLSEKLGSPGYPFYKSIEGAEEYHKGEVDRIAGIEVVDPYTVVFQLKEPDHTFLNAMALTFAYPIPKEEVEAAEAKYGVGGFGTHPTGTGPFAFKRWERGVEVEMERFEEYWAPKPRVDRIVYQENVENHLGTARLRNGDVDVHFRPLRAEMLFFLESDAWKPYLTRFASPSIYALTMNAELPPLDNVHVRRAVAYAIDREKLERFDPIRMMAADQLLPPNMPGHYDDLENRQYRDLDKAREELRLAGYPDGLPEPITVWVRSDQEQYLTEMMQEDLREVGIPIEIKRVSFATYLKETGRPRVAQAAFSGWHADFPDPSNFMDILFHSRAIHPENSENRSFYRNPKLDKLLDDARRTVDPDKRAEMYREASEILAHDAPWAYLTYPMETFVWQPYVKNFRIHPVWPRNYRDIWLDLPKKPAPRTAANQTEASP